MSIPETTLSTPLLEAAYTAFLDVYGRRRPPLNREIDRLASSLLTTSSSPDVSIVRRHVPQDTPHLAEVGLAHTDTATAEERLRSIKEIVRLHSSSLASSLNSLGSPPPHPVPDLIQSCAFDAPPVVLGLRRLLYWLNLVDQIVASSRARRWINFRGAWISRRVTLVPSSGVYLLLTTEVCLMMKDMLYSRFIIHLYCQIDPMRRAMSPHLDFFIHWGNSALRRLGNKAYGIIKGIEALSQTEIIRREEKILDGDGQHRSMTLKYELKEKEYGGDGSLTRQLVTFLSSMDTCRDVAESFGFMKLLGHPYVDPVSGCAAIQRIAKTPLHIEPSSCNELEWSFCHLYCRGYLKRNAEWPRLVFIERTDGQRTQLERLYRRGQPSLAFGFSQYPASDWMWVQFDTHLTMDMGEDILSHISDRAISFDRDHYDCTWSGNLPYRPPRSPTSGKALEELLARPDFNLAEIIEIVASGNIPDKWRIVAVSPKEREMKWDPRMFCMMVIEMRFFFVVTESNIGKNVFRSIPEQTMTMGRQELLRLFLDSTNPDRGKWITAVMSIDFSTWNTLWRNETVKPIGRRIDQMFGRAGVFSVVHDFFESSLCLLKSNDYPPAGLNQNNRMNPPLGPTLWKDHTGGFEGIAQKLWTACTVALVHMSLWPMGLSYRIMGQGDNQVVVLDCYIPTTVRERDVPPYMQSLIERAASRLESTSARVGQQIKPTECLYSTCFLTYGKEMILNGAYLPTTLKYVSRMFPTTTSDAPSLHEMVSSISSGAIGSTDRGEWTLPAYYLAKAIETFTFQRELRWSLLHGTKIRDLVSGLCGRGEKGLTSVLRKDLLLLLTSVPSNLGGLPITTVPELMYRGHPDPLSSSLAHLALLDRIPVVERYKSVIVKGWILSPSPDITGLVLDPYSLPLASPSPPSTAVARATSGILPEITHNKAFSALFERSSEKDKKALMTFLGSMRPYYPKIAHDIYKATLIGLRDSFARRFSNTRTLIGISKKAELDIASVSTSSDWRVIRKVIERFGLVWRVDITAPSYTLSTTYSTAVLLRRSWLGGEELEGVTTMFPLSAGMIEWLPTSTPQPSSLPSILALACSSSSTACRSTRGPVSPYLGSATSERTVEKWVRPIDSSPPLTDVLNLLSIRSMMTIPGTEAFDSLTRLAASRSFVEVNELETLVKVKYGGTLAHRYLTRNDSRGSYWNSCFNLPTHLTHSTNLSGELGRVDYPFDYQSSMLTLATLMSWTGALSHVPAPWGVRLIVDLARMAPVKDHMVNTDPLAGDLLPPAPNYYTSVLKVTLSPNALSSARLSRTRLALPGIREKPTLVSALTQLLLSHLRSGHPVSHRLGHTLGVPQAARVVDVPELHYIHTNEMLQALARACWLKIGLPLSLMCNRSNRRPTLLLRSMLDLEVRKGIPSLLGTLRETDMHSYGSISRPGLGRESEVRILSEWMCRVYQAGIDLTDRIPFVLFERGSASMSSSLGSYLGLVAANECIKGGTHRFKFGKLVGRLVRAALSLPVEQDKVRVLCHIARRLGIGALFRISEASPEEEVRIVRRRAIDPSFSQETSTVESASPPRVSRVYVPPQVVGEADGGVARLEYYRVLLTPSELVSSWLTRLDGVPASSERWAPLSSIESRVQTLLLIGVGNGDIGPALPDSWSVVGLELASVLSRLGHGVTTYSPPGIANPFSLHPLSWSTSGDVTDESVIEVVVRECRAKRYDLVVLDIEGIDTLTRLQLRSRIAESGVPTYCKILIAEADRHEFLRSWSAYSSSDDSLWTSLSYPGREWIVGRTEAPIGVFASVPSSRPCVVDWVLPRASDYLLSSPHPYSPSPDLLTLTGHIPVLQHGKIKLSQLRAVHPYCRFASPPRDAYHLFVLLLQNSCPRARVRALIRVWINGLVDSRTLLSLPRQLL